MCTKHTKCIDHGIQKDYVETDASQNSFHSFVLLLSPLTSEAIDYTLIVSNSLLIISNSDNACAMYNNNSSSIVCNNDNNLRIVMNSM
jgi:hypothetical protein